MTFPSVLSYLDGTMANGFAPSTIYVASIKGHPDFVKLGFCQLTSRSLRRSDPYIESILYDACTEDALIECIGDISRRDAYIVEQYLLALATAVRETIPSLAKAKWGGYTETMRVIGNDRVEFLEWVRFTAGNLLLRGNDGRMEALDLLVVSMEERELYAEIREEWIQQKALRQKRLAKSQ